MMDFHYYDTMPKEIATRIDAEHDRYERIQRVPCRFTPFCFVAKQKGKLVGAVNGYTAYAEVYVEDILVIAEHRGQGIGKQLLRQVYERFKNSGLENINLCTSAFQAPAFYEKCGFQLEFIRQNKCDSKLDKYFYIRYFGEVES